MNSNPQNDETAADGAADARPERPPHPPEPGGSVAPGPDSRPGLDAQSQPGVQPGIDGPSAEECTALLRDIGPLPLRGPAWPTPVKVMAWVVLLIIAMQITRVATGPHRHDVSPVAAAAVLICFLALLIVARFMLVSETRITQDGIEQSWIRPRRIAWDDILFVRFIPMLTSKRLICFSRSGRPVVFQAGTRELRAAFARIAQVYRRK